MTTQQDTARIILAKIGLDGHDRGVKVLANALRDAGMEVIYLGMRIAPEQIAVAALEENVDAIGISLLSGAHMRLMPKVVKALDDQGILGQPLLLIGGTIPDSDVASLQELGVDGVFPVGSPLSAIVDFIRENRRSRG